MFGQVESTGSKHGAFGSNLLCCRTSWHQRVIGFQYSVAVSLPVPQTRLGASCFVLEADRTHDGDDDDDDKDDGDGVVAAAVVG